MLPSGVVLATKPRWLVGAYCPFVSPYTMLFSAMWTMSGLRRRMLMKWFPPIPYPSPSPVMQITCRSWFASFVPIATGSARP